MATTQSSALYSSTTTEKKAPRKRLFPSGRAMIFMICATIFLVGLLFGSQIPLGPSTTYATAPRKFLLRRHAKDIMGEVSSAHRAIQSLGTTMASLQMELTAARGANNHIGQGGPPPRVFAVIGINTAFSSKKRRDVLRSTWMPTGPELKRLEEEKGIVLRFVIGHTATPGGAQDVAIDAEEAEHKDFLRLDHVEGYQELSTKTMVYFETVVSMWNADFYVKVDDDIHVNIGTLVATLARHRHKPRVYIGCMNSGPVLSNKEAKYYEPESWKFGDEGNRYFRYAAGGIYAISRDLASYISINVPILHRYANEDVTLGSWLIGLDVEHVDEGSFCCQSPPDCEQKASAGNVCAASYDWGCSGVCNMDERMKVVHETCGEGDGAVWSVDL